MRERIILETLDIGRQRDGQSRLVALPEQAVGRGVRLHLGAAQIGDAAIVHDQPEIQIVMLQRQHQPHRARRRSEEHTSELQSLMRLSYAVFCLKKKIHITHTSNTYTTTYN